MEVVRGGKIAAAEPIPHAEGTVPPLRFAGIHDEPCIGRIGTRAAFDGAFADLPPARPQRWGMRMKANVVAAVRQGYMSLGDVCDRYGLSAEEFLSWQSALDQFGLAGLRQRRARPARRHEAVRGRIFR